MFPVVPFGPPKQRSPQKRTQTDTRLARVGTTAAADLHSPPLPPNSDVLRPITFSSSKGDFLKIPAASRNVEADGSFLKYDQILKG